MASKRSQRQPLKIGLGLIIGSFVALGIGGWIAPSITIRGVPLGIIAQFLADPPARDAYFAGNKRALHDRLQALNIEAEIKAFYRPQFNDEQQLDQHIHQIFYEVSGFVGYGYFVNSQGILTLRDFRFDHWIPLAQKAGVITHSYYSDDGTPMVINAQGAVARFDVLGPLYPPALLQKMIKAQRRQLQNSPRHRSQPNGNL